MVLSDARMRKSSNLPNSLCNARLRILQSLNQADFIYHLFDLFKLYCSSSPKIYSSIIKKQEILDKTYPLLQASSPALPAIKLGLRSLKELLGATQRRGGKPGGGGERKRSGRATQGRALACFN
jgi:hypothetical protein